MQVLLTYRFAQEGVGSQGVGFAHIGDIVQVGQNHAERFREGVVLLDPGKYFEAVHRRQLQIEQQHRREGLTRRFHQLCKIEHGLPAVGDVPNVIRDSCNEDRSLNQPGVTIGILNQKYFPPNRLMRIRFH